MQSTLSCNGNLHVAIIMDGNGRWATARGLARAAGHRAGVESIRRVCEAAPALGIATLTLFAFSADNWRRPQAEVAMLMDLLRSYLRAEVARLVESGTRLSVIGRRDRLPEGLAHEIAAAQDRAVGGRALHLRIAIDYSARDSIVQAASSLRAGVEPTRENMHRLITGAASCGSGDVDLLIRSGGEKRLSDFLLWECAYAELCFTSRMWPEFGAEDLAAAIADFRGRERRFGGLGEARTRTEQVPSAA